MGTVPPDGLQLPAWRLPAPRATEVRRLLVHAAAVPPRVRLVPAVAVRRATRLVGVLGVPAGSVAVDRVLRLHASEHAATVFAVRSSAAHLPAGALASPVVRAALWPLLPLSGPALELFEHLAPSFPGPVQDLVVVVHAAVSGLAAPAGPVPAPSPAGGPGASPVWAPDGLRHGPVAAP